MYTNHFTFLEYFNIRHITKSYKSSALSDSAEVLVLEELYLATKLVL